MLDRLMEIICILAIVVPLLTLTILAMIQHAARDKRRKEHDNAERPDLERAPAPGADDN